MTVRKSVSKDLPTDGAAVLMQALKVWGPKGEHWIRGAWYRGDNYCLMGGLDKAAHGVIHPLTRTKAHTEAVQLVQAELPRQSIIGFNDASGRKFLEVKAIICKAISRGLAQRKSKKLQQAKKKG